MILSWLLDGAMWVRRKLRTAEEELVFRLIHLHPALTMAMAFLARRREARMGLALAVHVKGFGFWLRCGEQTLKFGAPLRWSRFAVASSSSRE